jgi:hypothetical protein
MTILACTTNGALAKQSLITRVSYVGGATPNVPALLLIHGSFAAGNLPVVTLGDISTATTSGNPASPDLVVTSFSTTDIVITVSHPLDSGILPATYRLEVRTFDASEREWHGVKFDVALGVLDLGLGGVFTGPVEAIVPPNATIGGRTVAFTAQTKFSGAGNPTGFADLNIGDKVEVFGPLQADGTVLALAIVRLP